MRDCWFFARALSKNGYGVTWDGSKVVYAHRLMYQVLVGEIPEKLELDHKCRNRSCINPDHLEPVSRSENTLRGVGPSLAKERQRAKTHCPRGHEYNNENTYIAPKHPDRRDCKKCRREARRRCDMKKRVLV